MNEPLAEYIRDVKAIDKKAVRMFKKQAGLMRQLEEHVCTVDQVSVESVSAFNQCVEKLKASAESEENVELRRQLQEHTDRDNAYLKAHGMSPLKSPSLSAGLRQLEAVPFSMRKTQDQLHQITANLNTSGKKNHAQKPSVKYATSADADLRLNQLLTRLLSFDDEGWSIYHQYNGIQTAWRKKREAQKPPVKFTSVFDGVNLLTAEMNRIFQQMKSPQDEFEAKLSELKDGLQAAKNRNATILDACSREEVVAEIIRCTVDIRELEKCHNIDRQEKETAYRQRLRVQRVRYNKSIRRICDAPLPATGPCEDGPEGTLVFYDDFLACSDEHSIPARQLRKRSHSAESDRRQPVELSGRRGTVYPRQQTRLRNRRKKRRDGGIPRILDGADGPDGPMPMAGPISTAQSAGQLDASSVHRNQQTVDRPGQATSSVNYYLPMGDASRQALPPTSYNSQMAGGAPAQAVSSANYYTPTTNALGNTGLLANYNPSMGNAPGPGMLLSGYGMQTMNAPGQLLYGMHQSRQ